MFGGFYEFINDEDYIKRRLRNTIYKAHIRKINGIIQKLTEIKEEFKSECRETFLKIITIKNQNKDSLNINEKKRLYNFFIDNLKKLDEEAKNLENNYLLSSPKKISEIINRLEDGNVIESINNSNDFCVSQNLNQIKGKYKNYDENALKKIFECNKIIEDFHFKKPKLENESDKMPIMMTFYLDNSKFPQNNSNNNIQVNSISAKKDFIEDGLNYFKPYFKLFSNKIDKYGYNYFQFGGELLENMDYNTIFGKFIESFIKSEKISSGNFKIYRFLEDIIIDTNFDFPSNIDSNRKMTISSNISLFLDVREELKNYEYSYNNINNFTIKN